MKNAFHFGLFLQKVNLLKDQRGDEKEGRFLVPDREQLLASLCENAEGALAYLTELPADEKGYRVFCAWSLFLGGASLSWIEKSFQAADGTKIPRNVTQELLASVEALVLDNDALRSGFHEYFPTLPALKVNGSNSDGTVVFPPFRRSSAKLRAYGTQTMLISMLSLLSSLWTTQASWAMSNPLSSVLGDWDLGTASPALRITEKDSESVFVQFCDRDTLVNQHVCNATVIVYFNFSSSADGFVHDDNGSPHLHATIQPDTSDVTVIHYSFTSDTGSGDLTGKKL